MCSVGELVNRYLFKKRFVFVTDQIPDAASRQHERSLFTVQVISCPETAITQDTGAFLADRFGLGTVNRRLSNRLCTLFLARVSTTKQPVGCYWSLEAKTYPVWHDNFRVLPGDALLFNAYVDSVYRRQGVYTLLQDTAHRYLLNDKGCRAVYTIVEESNEASVQANRRFGLVVDRRNYLVKALGINVLSIFRSASGWEIHFVFANAKSNRI